MSEDKHVYQIDLEWKEGRIGRLRSPDFDTEIDVATPPQFPGGVEGKWSPEHLFAASVSSCFMTTFIAIAGYSKLSFEDLSVNTICRLDKEDGKFIVSEIELKAELAISDEKHTDKAIRIMEKAEAACLITRSIKTKVILKPSVTVGTLN